LTPRPFRFGLSASRKRARTEWIDLARRVEALGYDELFMPDHFGPIFAIAPALVLAAQASSRLRVGSLVYDNDFRHPGLLAQEVATIDALTDGRFDFGIGAGWFKPEYDAMGIPFDEGQRRVDRLAESIQLIKRLLGGERVTFRGRHYQLHDASAGFAAVQQPHPPLLMGGGGKRLLTIAASEAQIISIMPRSRRDGSGLEDADVTAAAFSEKVSWIKQAAGTRISQIELNTLVQVVSVTEKPAPEAERLAQEWKMPPSVLLASPLLLIGTPEQIAEILIAHREQLGISFITVFEKDLEPFARVIERLRALGLSAG
jgi:probable F420-dependent oxidoreductase